MSDHDNSCNFNITISDVSENEKNGSDYLEIYPNPSIGTININSNYQKIEIHNQLGVLVKTLSINESQWIPDLNSSSGIFEIVARKGSKIEVKKAIFLK